MKYSFLILPILLFVFSFYLYPQNIELTNDIENLKIISRTQNNFDLFAFMDEEQQSNRSYNDEYYKKSIEFFENGKYDSSLVYASLDSAASSFISQNSLEFSRSLILLSKIYRKLHYHNLAINVLTKAFEIENPKDIKDYDKLKTILFELSTLYIITSNYKSAEPMLYELIIIHKESKLLDTVGYISALNNLAILSKQKANYNKAEEIYSELIALTKSKYGNKSNEYSKVLSNYASFCNSQEKNEEAETIYNEIINIDKANNNEITKSHAIALNNLASLYLQTGRLYEAETFFKRAIGIFEKLNDTKSYQYFSLVFNYARFQDYSGQNELAEKNYLKALNGFEATLGNKNIQITAVLNNLSVILIKQNKLNEAEETMNRVNAILLELLGNKHPSYSASMLNLSDLYRLKGQYSKSDSLLELCLEIENLRGSTNQPSKAAILSKKGTISLDMAKYLQAEVYFRSALNINELNFLFPIPRITSDYVNLGIALFHQNKKKEAKDCFSKAITNIQELIKKYFPYCTEYEKAVYYDTLYSQLQKIYNYAVLLTKDFPDMEESISSSIITHKAILFNYTGILKEQVLESNNSLLINQYKKWESSKNDYAKKYRNLSLTFKNANTLDSAIQYLSNLEKEIASSVGSQRNENEYFNIDCKSISERLKSSEVYIQLVRVKKYGRRQNQYTRSVTSLSFLDSSFYIALIIHPSKNQSVKNKNKYLELVILENGSDIDSLAPALYYQSLQLHRNKKVDIVQINVNQEFLYSILWEKIKDKINNPKIVYLSPDGSYNSINLNTLINPKNGKYIIEETDLRLNYSFIEFSKVRNKKQPNKINTQKTKDIAVLFGDPQFYADSSNIAQVASRYQNRNVSESSSEYVEYLILRYGLISLPGSRKEIQNISKVLKKKKWTIKTLVGAEAKEDSIKCVFIPRVLHIATHGLFLSNKENRLAEYEESFSIYSNPLLRSYLLFAGVESIFDEDDQSGMKEDGLLSAYEAMTLNLRGTELVVLSACETGLGTIRNGEGIYGMQRAFQLAGAKSVLMSLWNVSDLATQELMTRFYTLWLIKGKPKNKAFREAQLELKDKYPNFYFWGAFVMVGE